jgi:hypothetical protein
MRTTITLDPDVEQLLQKTMRERDVTFKQAVNDGLRQGLKRKPERLRHFRQRTFAIGSDRSMGEDKALAFAAELEDRDRRRKMGFGE